MFVSISVFCLSLGWYSGNVVADICFVMQTTQPCLEAADPIEQKVCSDTACIYEITSWEPTSDPRFERPVLTWMCPEGTKGIYDYDPYQEIESCEQSNTAMNGKKVQVPNDVKKVCFYRGSCGGGCVALQETFQLDNRLAPNVSGTAAPGKSTYQRQGCVNASVSENDRNYNFADYNKCTGITSPCANEETQ
jgi:hypothetical protein